MKSILLFAILFVNFSWAQQTVAAISGNEADKVYRTPEVDSKPEIKDGMYTLPLFVSENFKLPDVHNKKLKLFVGFIVETDGSISNVRFIHLSVSDLIEANVPKEISEQQREFETAELDKMKDEAIRVISAFKKPWIPAVKNAKAVRCQYNYPINFNLE